MTKMQRERALLQLAGDMVNQVVGRQYMVGPANYFFVDLDFHLIGIDRNIIPTRRTMEFLHILYEMFPDAPRLGVFLYSVLHELGHIETENEMENDDDVRMQIGMPQREYAALPNEFLASEWAVNFAKENLNLCNDWYARYDAIMQEEETEDEEEKNSLFTVKFSNGSIVTYSSSSNNSGYFSGVYRPSNLKIWGVY